jgi:hypothetical protein
MTNSKAVRIVDGHGYCAEHSPRCVAVESIIEDGQGRECTVCAEPCGKTTPLNVREVSHE